jgi:streptomycin 6-kinase
VSKRTYVQDAFYRFTPSKRRLVEASISSDRYVNTLTIECADYRLENRRLAEHIVKRGTLAAKEWCYFHEDGRSDYWEQI